MSIKAKVESYLSLIIYKKMTKSHTKFKIFQKTFDLYRTIVYNSICKFEFLLMLFILINVKEGVESGKVL